MAIVNTKFGEGTLLKLTTGNLLTAFGYSALRENTSGNYNTAFGESALASNITGSGNGAFGLGSLATNSTGNGNNAFGEEALFFNTTGSYNTAIGNAASRKNTTGAQNTSVGDQALWANTTGGNNLAAGDAALINMTSGDNNVAIGYSSGSTLTSGSNNILIGATTQPSSATVSNECTIGNDSITKTRLKGDVEILGNIIGKFYTPAFSSSDFTASGSMTWTVESGDVGTYTYTIIGKMMTVMFYIVSSSVGGTLDTALRITVPAGKTIAKTAFNMMGMFNNNVEEVGRIRAEATRQYVELFRVPVSNWSAATNTTYVFGQISFEIQ